MAERAALGAVSGNVIDRAGFAITSIHPTSLLGPILLPPRSPRDFNAFNRMISKLLMGAFAHGLPPNEPFGWADVRDVALAHVRALETPAVADQRITISAGKCDYNEICEIVRRVSPEYATRMPPASAPDDESLRDKANGVDAGHSLELVDLNCRPLLDSVTDVVRSLESAGVVKPPSGQTLEEVLEHFLRQD